ncbi:putative O-antigen transporter [Sulfuriferula plumbiphila]|nr:putative O-antigen transporter [Sulfuriferula plumbiphila]
MSRKALVKNSLINLAGFALPLTVGLITIPLIVRGFGVERFGLLTLAWAVIGYFSLFDLGIGRAITQLIAERLDKSPAEDVARLAWTGLLMMAVFALIGAIFTASLTPWFVSSVLNMPEALREEAIWAFIMLAAAIPAVVLSAGFAGVLAAIQRFDLINALRIPMGMMIFLVPLAILPYSKSMAYVCAGLMVIRFLFLVLHAVVCFYAFPSLRAHVGIERSEIRRLLNFGGWMTVTNVIGPFMVYMDRFVIGAALSISAVAYYVTPYEMVTRLWAIPAAIVTVLFPAFAASKNNGSSHAAALYSMGGRAILVILAPIVLVLVVFAKEGLNVWLGSDFSQKSAAVLQWLAMGVYLNSYAQVPFAFIQGIGRADITAKLHLLELPIYIALMFWLLNTHGIIGVAIAWLLRIAVDAVLLTLVAHWLSKDMAAASRQIFPMLATLLVLFAAGMMLDETVGKLFFTGAAFLALILVVYFFAVTPEEKNAIRKSAQRFLRT